MPKYKVNGRTFNIPDNEVDLFEADFPEAQLHYQTTDGRKFTIFANERKDFLSDFPDATELGWSETVKEQAKQADPFQPESDLAQPLYGSASYQDNIGKPEDYNYYPSPLSEEGRAEYEPISAEERSKQEYEMLMRQLEDFNATNGNLMDTYEAYEEVAKHQTNEGGLAIDTPERRYLEENSSAYYQRKKEKDELNSRIKNNSYFNQMRTAEADAANETVDAISNLMAQNEAENTELHKKMRAMNALALNPRGSFSGVAKTKEMQEYMDERADLETAKRLYENTAQVYAAPINDGEDILKKFGKGFGQRVDEADFWTMGIVGIADDMNARAAFQKIQDKFGSVKEFANLTDAEIDALLTPSEQLLISAVMDNNAAMYARKDNTAGAYEAGAGAADSLMFMAQFLLTGGIGDAATVGTAAHKRLVSWLGRKVGSMSNSLMRDVARGAVKLGVGTAESIGKALVMTPLMPHTYANIADKMMSFDNSGELMDTTDAIISGSIDALIETWSESTGDFVNKILGVPGDITKGIAKKALKNVDFSEWGKAMNAPMMKLLKKGGFNGFLGEMGEEFIGNATRSLIGTLAPGSGQDPEALKNFAQWEQLLVTAGSFAPMTILGIGASSAQYGLAKRKLNNAQKAFEAMLRNASHTEDQVNYIVDELLGSTDAHLTPERLVANFSPLLRELAFNDRYANNRTQTMQAAVDFMWQIARYRAFDGIYHRQEEQQRNDMLAEIQEGTGREFWTTRLSENAGLDGTAYETNEVRAVEFNDGRVAYVLGGDGVNNTVVYNDGQTGFLSEEQLNEGKANGSIVSDATMSLNDYLTQQVARVRMTEEEQRMFAERNTNIDAIRAQFPQDATVELGTTEAPIQGIVRQQTPNGVLVESPAGISQLAWEELGHTIGIEANPQTDAQMEEEAINNLEIADLQRRRAREQRRTQRNAAAEAALTEEQLLDEAENEGLEKPIPMKADGTVDQTAFWNESPARWAQWKTEQRQDGGAYASTYIQNAIGILEGQIAESEAAFLAESDFDAKDALEQTINQQRARLAELQDLAMQYMPAVIPAETSAEATAGQTQPAVETSQPAAVMAERQKFELDAEYQRRLSLAKALAEKEMILKEYFEAISAGSLEAVVMNKQNYKQIMKENGCDEAAIEMVTNAIKFAEEENKAVDALHVNDKIFIVSEYVTSIEGGRVSYVHERQHNITKNRPELVQRILSLGLDRETMQKIVRMLSGSKFYEKKSDEVLADEILSFTMEIAYTFDDFSVTLSKLGLPIELINLINEINDEQRKDFTLVNARRNSNALDSGQRDSGQNDGDSGQVSGGILGQEGVRPSENSERRDEAGESGESATGGAEASEEGLQVPVAEVDEESENKPQGPDFRVTKPEDNLSDETKQELADKGLVMDGGAIMSDEYADLKHELGYETPIEQGASTDDLRFSITTMPGWRKNYLTYKNAEKRIVNILEAFAARITANELVNGVVAQGQHKSSKKTKDGRLVESGPLRSNISYVVTFDLDTSCPRTFQYLNFVRRIERRISRPMTQIECIQLNEMMRMYGQQIPCVYCYAENKRQAMKQYFNNYIASRHAVLSAETDEEALKHMYGREAEGTNPKTVLTEAAYKVFVKWRKNPKGTYNPSMRMLWNQYDQARNSILSLLDMRYEAGAVKTDSSDETIAKNIAGELGIKNKTAIKAIEEIVVEWKWNTIEGRKHDDFTPVDEDDIWANENALEVWRDMTLYAKSASGAKNVNRYVPYTDELKNVDQATRDYINGMGGLRMHSTNDFRIDYVFDYFQFFADMAAAKMFGHTYSKSPEFVRIFGNSGYKINMSIAAYQDENGVIRPNVDEGFDWNEAQELRKLFPHAGTMLMATSDEQLQLALDSDWIDMCIPFHHSGLPKAVWYNMRLWTDYTSVQNERYFNNEERIAMLTEAGVEIPKRASTETIEEIFNEHFGIKVLYGRSGKRVKPHFLPGPTIVDGVDIPGHNNNHEEYLRLCREYGVKPRFEGIKVKDNTPEGGGRIVDITEHPRYMILVKETARTDTPQTAIQFNFDQPSEALGGKTPMDYAFEELEARAMAESELAGKKVRDIYNSLNNDQFGIVEQFLNTIIKHKNETGEDYPMDYLTPESREWFLVQRKALEEAFKDIEAIPYHRNEYDEQGNLIKGEGLEREEVIDLVEEAKKAQKKHDEKENDVRFRMSNDNQAIFVSNAARAVEGIKQEKATPEQWLKMIEKNGGLKAGEDKWMGLSDWLKASDKKTLTKQEVLDFVNENMIIIEEQHYQMFFQDDIDEATEKNMTEKYGEEFMRKFFGDAFIVEDDVRYGWRLAIFNEETAAELYNQLNGTSVKPGEYGFESEDYDIIVRWGTKIVRDAETIDGVRRINDTREIYQSKGLTNRHEIALTVPTIESWNENDPIHFGEAGEGRAVAWIRFGDTIAEVSTEAEMEAWKEFDEFIKELYAKYGDSDAWTLEESKKYSDLLAKTKVAKEQKKVLVIDEIQSKRHQDARELGGYRVADIDKWLADRGIEVKETGEFYEFYYNNGELDRRFSKGLLHNNIEEAKKLYVSGYNRSNVPDAPFEKNWHELAMKRMLRYAAENGYDAIAWTKGAQQNKRYNLSKVVDHIQLGMDFTKQRKSSFRMYLKNGIDHHVGVDRETGLVTFYNKNTKAIGKPLSALLGKELAEKVLGGRDYQILTEVDFELSKGMKGFYDEILPAFMNKYGKQWGIKVKNILLNRVEDGISMHSVPVTEEMKSSVMEGQVMFRVRGENEAAVDFCLSAANEVTSKYRIDAKTRVAEVNEKNAKKFGYKDGKITDDAIYLPDYNMIVIFAHEHFGNTLDVECAIFHEIVHKYADPTVGEWLWRYADGVEHLAEIKQKIAEKYPEEEYSDEDRYEEMLCESMAQAMTSGTANGLWRVLPANHQNSVDKILNEIRYDRNNESTDRVRRALGGSQSSESGNQRVPGQKEGANDVQSGDEEENAANADRRSRNSSLTAEERRIINEYFPGAFPEEENDAQSDNTGEFSEGEGGIRYRVVTDSAKIEELENGEKIKVYRAMQLIDGKLYPPMSAKVDGQLREPIELGQWEEAEERPDLADNKGYFKLDKGNKKSLKARYNPYFHTSYTPLNDQFSEAQDRPNLVTVEVEIPVSELTSGYKADKAKDSVGEKEWKAGVIQGKLSGTRKVILSRWDKPVRIVPDSEVADVIVKMFEGKDIVMPSNVVTPSLRAELEKRGVPFVETDNQGKSVKPSLLNVIKTLFTKGKQVAAKMFSQSFFDVADTPEFMKALGLTGSKFTVRYGVIARHFGKDGSHDLTEKDWEKLPEALRNPFAITRLKDDSKAFRVYTTLQTSQGEYVVVGVDVKNAGKNLEVNAISTLFGRRSNANLTQNEEVIYESNDITPEQSSLLKQPNSAQYPTDQGLSDDKDSDNIDTSNELDENTSFRVTGTPTEEVVAEGVSLSPAQLASLAGDIFAALPEESRKKITDGLNGNILGLQDAILQIPTSLATKENWNEEDRQMAEVVAEQMTKAIGKEMTRPFSASEALWTLYNAVNKSTDLVSEASRALVRRNLGFDSQTLEMERSAREGVRFRTVGNASANAQASMYNRGAANVRTRLKEVYVDMHASVEKLVKAIEKRSGKVAQGFENILMALNQQSSKGLAAMEAYEQKFLNKMFDEIRAIMDKTDFKYEDIVRYVILKHGLERNVKMAQRDAKAHYQEIYDDIIAKIKGMNPAQKRTYLTNAQLRDADAKAELARLQAVNTSALTPDQLRDHKKELAKAKKEAAEAAEHLVRAQKIATLTEQDAQDELDKIFKKIEKGTDSIYKEMRKNDYSGISSMFYDTLGVDRKNYATEEEYQAALMQAKADKYDNLGDIEGAAQMEVTFFENAVNTDKLWKSINKATKETLRQQYEANMISKDQYENLRDMFEFYVPLRGFKDNTAEDMYTYYRRPNSTGYTKPILGAEGRKTEAESPFGWIAAMAGSAIASNVKNEAKLALYYFVANRPDNGIATLSRTWFVHTPGDVDANGKKIFRPAYPPFNQDLSTDAAKQAYEDWQDQMRDLQKQGLAYEAGQRLNLGNAVVNISDTNKPEHIVNVKVGGKDYTIVINGNPRAAQAINGDLNIESTSQDYSTVFGPMLRWMSSVNTSYNPEFWITNMMRDVAFTMMAVNIKEDPAYRRKFTKNYAKAFKVVSMVAKNEKGTLGNSYIERMYKDFVKYGGVTGYTQIKDSETWEKEIENYLTSNDPASIRNGKVMRGMKSLFHGAHRFGESLEQVSRFAAFLTAVETGKSINEAINDAKEITVNFNRKGSGKMITLEEAKYLTDKNGQPLNKLEQWAAVGLSSIAPLGRRFIMFFNAAIQGLNATYKLYAKNKTKAIGWALGYAAVGMMNAVIHAMLDDDDDYLDIPQYERRNSLMIGGNGAYFKWALPQEARAFYALGDLAVESFMGRNPHQNVIGEALKISTEILPINPVEGWKAFMPSVAVPVVELALNEDYKGAPIYNEQKWLTEEEKERSAKWSKAYQGTGKPYVSLSKVLNSMSGGDEYNAGWINIQPEKVQHLVQSAFGGTIRTADKFINTIMAAIDPEEDVTVRQFPFLNRFLTINDERYKNVHVNDVYDHYAAEAEHAQTLQKQYIKNRNADALKDLRSSDEYKWAKIYSKYKKPIKKYQEAIRAADTASERMELMKQQDELKRKMIKEISEL